MKVSKRFGSALLMTALLGLGVIASQAGLNARAQDAQAPAADGALLFKNYCAACHMDDGSGVGPQEGAGAYNYPPLAGNPLTQSADYIIIRILHGQGAMPTFARSLNDEQVAAIVNHVRTGLNEAQDEIGPEKVAELRGG